jgi:hypothetical protein
MEKAPQGKNIKSKVARAVSPDGTNFRSLAIGGATGTGGGTGKRGHHDRWFMV